MRPPITAINGLYDWSCNMTVELVDGPRSGRPVTDKVDDILKKEEQDRRISSYGIAEELGIDHKTVLDHLKNLGLTQAH
ncbi:hypothetical protein EVAR_78433_1 [Eumeta japonica]|uniref:Histone-lysine N-methyltransferase SETMAR n=1 Tax=Eumeta variegata TaxID=151549 RepID=A0A4C1TY40_EUMVA|nr:hypothetical protein EVAR_78433_1 [Eumeta japonica]